MALVCNKKVEVSPAASSEASLYLDAERYIEAGSAHFGQAFGEALGLIADIELHNQEGAGLRLGSIASLLEHALRQYETAVERGLNSGLDQYHDQKLREAGLELNGVRRVLTEAQSRGFLMDDHDRIETIALNFDRFGHSGLMSLYLKKVRVIHDLVVTAADIDGRQYDGVASQELGWRLTSLFSDAIEVGKAIAVINTFTFRLPTETVSSLATINSAPKLNS